MNLLVLTNNPSRASFRQRIEVHLDLLRDNGINCQILKFPSNIRLRHQMLKKGEEFDAVFLHKKRMNFLDAMTLRRNAKKIIYDFDDAIMYSDKAPDKPSRKRQNSFRRTVKLADLVIAGNNYLAEHARKLSKNVHVIPTGLKTSDYLQDPQPANDGKIRLVWIGSKSTLAYLSSIKDALEEVADRFDDVILRIICDDFFDLQNMAVEKHLWSLQNQAKHLMECDIGLAPLPDNNFTKGKCGFKILQYQSASLPTVASPVGVNAELIEHGNNGLLAKNKSEWIETISKLVQDERARKQMGQTALSNVQNFDLKVIGQQLTELIKTQ